MKILRIATRALSGAALLSGLALVTGCDHYERTRIDAVTASGLGGSVSPVKISVPVGTVVKAHLEPLDDDGDSMEGEAFSEDPSILEVLPGPLKDDYVFVGRKAGATRVVLLVDGTREHVIPAEVTVQDDP